MEPVNVVQIFQWIGLGGFIAWAVLERGFSLSKQQQTGGLRLAAASYWWISISWYASQFYALADSWMGGWTTFAALLWGLRGLGAALTLAGVALRFLARRELGKQYSVHVETSKKHQLVTTGVYQRLRHPAYLGLLCLFLGIPLCLGSWGGLGLAALLGIPAVVSRIRVEERWLREWFGEAYMRYAKHSWRLIPYVW